MFQGTNGNIPFPVLRNSVLRQLILSLGWLLSLLLCMALHLFLEQSLLFYQHSSPYMKKALENMQSWAPSNFLILLPTQRKRPRMYFKSQAITCCLIQVDSSSEIQLSQNFVLISFASSQFYVQNHIHNYFPDMAVSLDILPIHELIKHKQVSSSICCSFSFEPFCQP